MPSDKAHTRKGRIPTWVIIVAWFCVACLVGGFLPLAGVILPVAADVLLTVAMAAVMFWLLRHRSYRVATPASVFILVISGFLGFFVFGERKHFVQDARRIEVGMTRKKVAEVMHDYSHGHPWGRAWPYLESSDPNKELWNHNGTGGTSFDHCVVRYNPTGVVADVEIILD